MLPDNSSPDSLRTKDSAPLKKDGSSKKKKSPYEAKTLKQIAAELGIGIAVARKWIKEIPEIGKRVGNYFTPIQVYKIYHQCGHPDQLLG
jgi:hypothetical protein